MELVLYPDPALKRPPDRVEVFDEALRAQVQAMFDLMYKSKGVGLAGPQVDYPRRLAVINTSWEPKDELVLVNPEIVSMSGQEVDEEGCLSFPGLMGKVERAKVCTVHAFGLDGKPFEVTGEGLLARALQHEVDHLDGILFVTRLSPAERQALKKDLRELETKWKEKQKPKRYIRK